MTAYRVKHKMQALQRNKGLQINDQRADKKRHHLTVCISLEWGCVFLYLANMFLSDWSWKLFENTSRDLVVTPVNSLHWHLENMINVYHMVKMCVRACVRKGGGCIYDLKKTPEILILLISWWKRPRSRRIDISFDVSGFWVLVKHFWRFRNICD